MERSLDRALAAVEALEEAIEGYDAVTDDLRKLEAYLNSEERRRDIAADEADRLPVELRCGVLSEDAVWGLLEQNDELLKRLKEITEQ